jgi:antitoxin (DNA-binding transcriptional repressor) of toxin-antitoxin stability system
MEVNLHEAPTHLSPLLERAAMGEEVIIAIPSNEFLLRKA